MDIDIEANILICAIQRISLLGFLLLLLRLHYGELRVLGLELVSCVSSDVLVAWNPINLTRVVVVVFSPHVARQWNAAPACRLNHPDDQSVDVEDVRSKLVWS